MPRDDDDPAGRFFLEVIEQLETAAVRQHEVQQDEVGRGLLQRIARGFEGAGNPCLVALQLEIVSHGFGEAGLVVDDQYARHDVSSAGARVRGRRF